MVDFVGIICHGCGQEFTRQCGKRNVYCPRCKSAGASAPVQDRYIGCGERSQSSINAALRKRYKLATKTPARWIGFRRALAFWVSIWEPGMILEDETPEKRCWALGEGGELTPAERPVPAGARSVYGFRVAR